MPEQHLVGIVMPIGIEYSSWLTEGAVAYIDEHPDLRATEIPLRSYGKSPLPRNEMPFDALLTWVSDEDRWVEQLWQQGVKVVNCSADLRSAGMPMVTFGRSCERAIEHLAGLGRKRIVYFGLDTIKHPAWASLGDRFLRMVEDRGLHHHVFEWRGVDPTDHPEVLLDIKGEKKLVQFLEELPTPAAAWCPHDHLAVLLSRVAQKVGLRIPADLAVLGLGDYLAARFADPPISTIPQPGREVGYAAMKLLHAMLENRTMPKGLWVQIPTPPVIERESTGGRADRDADIEPAYHLIQHRACEGITVNEVVRTTAVCRKTFTERFKAAYGRTPGEELRRVKLERAKYLLATTGLTATRIAGLCGFRERGKFYTFFKREAGCGPLEYRRQNTPGGAFTAASSRRRISGGPSGACTSPSSGSGL